MYYENLFLTGQNEQPLDSSHILQKEIPIKSPSSGYKSPIRFVNCGLEMRFRQKIFSTRLNKADNFDLLASTKSRYQGCILPRFGKNK